VFPAVTVAVHRLVVTLIHVATPLRVVVAKPRAHLVSGTIHISAIIRAIAIAMVATTTIPVFVTLCHVSLLCE
jgi:hypothetical protein